MGTNFYGELNKEEKHIGKRSAAGAYCWDCKRTLCADGESKVHETSFWFGACPVCGKKSEEEDLEHSTAGRELGFNKNKPEKKMGIKSCSSFTWDIELAELAKMKNLKDEYDRKFSKKEFMNVLAECPIQFFDAIGNDFS